MWQKIISIIISVVGGCIIFMAQTSYIEAISNFVTWLPEFIIRLLPSVTQSKDFDQYISILGIILIFIAAVIVWLKNKSKVDKKHKLKSLNNFITFKEAVDYCIDFREETGVSIDIINRSKKRDHDFLSLLYAHPEPITIIDSDLYSILHLIKQNEITLYGQRTETVKNIRPIDLGKIDENVYLNVKSWSKDLNSLSDNDKLLYTNLSIKQKDINSLIERGKLQKEHVIQGILKNN